MSKGEKIHWRGKAQLWKGNVCFKVSKEKSGLFGLA